MGAPSYCLLFHSFPHSNCREGEKTAKKEGKKGRRGRKGKKKRKEDGYHAELGVLHRFFVVRWPARGGRKGKGDEGKRKSPHRITF